MRRALRAPKLIVAELLAVALAGVSVASLPQIADRAARTRFALEHPRADAWVSALGLDRVLHAPWFLALVALSTASLAVVLVEQWRRVPRLWRATASAEEVLAGAQHRRALEVPAAEGAAPAARVERAGRLGVLGSPLFHLGLMVVLLAGGWRALFGAEAGVTLVEGQEVGAGPAGFAQFGGPLARPFALEHPLRLDRVEARRWASGELAALAAEVAIRRGGAWAPARVAINAPLDVGAERLYLVSNHGPAALLEVERSDGGTERRAVALQANGVGRFAATEAFGDGTEVRLAAAIGADAALPPALEVRVLRRGGLLYSGPIAPGEALPLAPGGRVVLHGLRYWADFQGTRDPTVPFAFAGFALVMLGAILMFAVVPVDTAVVVTPLGGGRARVEVALRARRFAPMFGERFEALVRREGAGRGTV